VNLRLNTDGGRIARRKQAQAKTPAPEVSAEDWAKIFAMKLTDADRAKLIEVKAEFDAGRMTRLSEDKYTKTGRPKAFSKAEALRRYAELVERRRAETLRRMVENTPDNYHLVNTAESMAFMIDVIRAADLIAIDCETFGEDDGALDPWKGRMAGFSVSTREHSFYVPLNHATGTQLNEIPAELRKLLETKPSVMHNAPFDCKWFAVQYGINLIDTLHADTRIMAMALDENRDHRLKNLLTDWLHEPSDNFDELFGKTPFNEIPLDVALPYAAGDTDKTLKLYDWIMRHLNTDRLADIKRLIFEIEMPVCREFIKADLRGVKFDVDRARELDAKLAEEEAELERKIHGYLGEEINLNSPAQVSAKFFGELGLTDYGKGSTNNRFIKKLKKEHPVIPLFLEYKEIGKLRSAFTQKLPNDVKRDGLIHPWHNTYGAATGRFTCANPNTQQIPAKRPEIRHLFKAKGPDRILVSIDYSQIELRVLAHMANESVLIEAFKHGRDIHSTTAALISAGKYMYEEIEAEKDTDGSPQQKLRKQAKIVNFGIVYGMGASKLADTLEITKEEAQKIIDDYFRGYPGIKRYMDEQHRKIMQQGYVTDIFGRKRRLHNEVKSKEKWRVFAAQRQAGNFPIQASAGSILKKAIVDLVKILPEFDSYILLQCHDEVLFDCPRNIDRESLHIIRDTMANAVKLRCPIKCDIEIYPERWQMKVSEEEWFGKEAVNVETNAN